jgi:hypothetical protein
VHRKPPSMVHIYSVADPWHFGVVPDPDLYLKKDKRIRIRSGSGSIPLTNRSGSRRPKNMWVHCNCLLGSSIWVIANLPKYSHFSNHSALTQQTAESHFAKTAQYVDSKLCEITLVLRQREMQFLLCYCKYQKKKKKKKKISRMGFLFCWVTLNVQSIFWAIKPSLEKILSSAYAEPKQIIKNLINEYLPLWYGTVYQGQPSFKFFV